MTGRTLTIEQDYRVNAPASRVFRALSEPSGLARWFLARAKLEPRTGSEYEFVWQGGYHHTGVVLDFAAGRRISLSWPNRVGRESLITRVTLSVRRDGAGTIVRLRHAGYPRRDPWIEVYGATEYGWANFLTNLKSVLEHGHDLRPRRPRRRTRAR